MYSPYSASPGRTTLGKDRTRGQIVTIIALLTLLALFVPIGYVIFQQATHQITNPTPITNTNPTAPPAATSPAATATPNTTATAQAQGQATATAQAQAQATATAVAGAPTATAQAQASATAGVVQTATAGNPAYQDKLTSATAASTVAMKWQQEAGKCVFQTDGYHVQASTGGALVGCRESGQQFDNVSIAVDVVVKSGHSGGLFFHQNVNLVGAYSGILFEIAPAQNQYRITSASNYSTSSDYKVLQDWTSSSAIKGEAGAKNRLTVIAKKNGDLLFYINNVYLTINPTLKDASYPTGYLAFLATTTSSEAAADVVYSNIAVYPQP
jgi:hypothetical protein